MEFQANPNDQYQNSQQQPLPNATAILVLGIVSIVGCCLYGTVGFICGIIALVMAAKARELYKSNPGLYTEASYKNMNGGRICAIIGLTLSLLYIILIIILISIMGLSALTNPNAWRELQGM